MIGIIPETVPLSVALAARAKKGEFRKAWPSFLDPPIRGCRLNTYPYLLVTAAEDAEGPLDESTTTLADIMPKIPLFPSTDPEYPDALVKKAPGGHPKKAKAVVEKVQATKSKETTPVVAAVSLLDSYGLVNLLV